MKGGGGVGEGEGEGQEENEEEEDGIQLVAGFWCLDIDIGMRSCRSPLCLANRSSAA